MGKQSAAIRKQLERQVAKATTMLVLEIDANLRETTPVDTGNARAHWVPSVGAESPLDDHDAGVAAVLRYKLADGKAFISNHVPYISMLDLGHSRQAPAGFVEAAIARGLETVQSRFDSLKIDLSATGGGTFSDAAGGAAASNLASAYRP